MKEKGKGDRIDARSEGRQRSVHSEKLTWRGRRGEDQRTWKQHSGGPRIQMALPINTQEISS